MPPAFRYLYFRAIRDISQIFGLISKSDVSKRKVVSIRNGSGFLKEGFLEKQKADLKDRPLG
jgi:hypothetical protein